MTRKQTNKQTDKQTKKKSTKSLELIATRTRNLMKDKLIENTSLIKTQAKKSVNFVNFLCLSINEF